MSDKVIDQAVRNELLTPYESFIVQAPAGSGKTELLTQRILALLTVVEKPENILAITFTRKAAAEMQSRVISALQLAQMPEPKAAHDKQRWLLARKVLEKDAQKGWRLLQNPTRLNLTTIDSLSASLSGALPLLSQTGALPKIAENATQYYLEAADNLLASISDGDETAENIKILLKHKDNNLNQVTELISQMLARRLQWLAQIKSHVREFDELQLVHSLEVITTEKLQQIYYAIPNDIVSELPALLNQAKEILSVNEKVNKPHLQLLQPVNAIALPEYEDLSLWKAIAELFLKAGKKPEILKSFTVSSGFPPEKGASDPDQKQQFKHNKKQVTEIAKTLAQLDGISELLLQVKLLPEQIESSVSQQSLQAAVALLPIAVAHLKLIFSRYNIIDFSELSLASLDALGHPDMPSDLALALDYRLEHILIDEFQDTSTPQVELIKLLIAGWEQDSARTLFLVGDPMQSIYRFRDANVGLFMQISTHGLGQVNLKFRQLQVNFRSSSTIVNWVNQQFERIMPAIDDVTFSAVSYAKSVAFNEVSEGSKVETILTVDTEDNHAQAEKILQVVKKHLEDNVQSKKKKTLAILARSRNNFEEIIQLLNQQSITFQAVEIDRLSQKMVVKDLTSLAFALCDQYDELSWAACMRSPWFGLNLDDIRQVMVTTDISLPLPQRITSAMALMPPESRERCQKILPILKSTITFKGRKPFRKWLYGCFEAVAGLSQLDFESDLDDLMVCLDKLDELSEGGELNDRQLVNQAIERLFATPNPTADAQVQVMTIHKSKGLEFDTVILPRLDGRKREGDHELLKWTEVVDEQGDVHNLLAISKETGKDNDSVYEYIAYLDKEKSKYEDQRVLYVAATRAKEKLYLFGNINTDSKSKSKSNSNSSSSSKTESEYKNPGSSSFLSMLWPGIMETFIPLNDVGWDKCEVDDNSGNLYQSRYVKQVDLERVSVIPVEELPEATPDNDISDSSEAVASEAVAELEAPELSSVIGSVLHRQLQWISERYQADFRLPENWETITRSQLQQVFQFTSDQELEGAVSKVVKGINNTLMDDFGRLILGARNEAGSEMVLHKKLEQGSFLSRIVDRAFVHNDTRWVIDYKSSQPEKGESVQAFVAREKAIYFPQINDYFKMFVELENRSIIAGLYFPMIAHFEKVLDSST